MSETQAIREAFEQILRANFAAAQRALAQAQLMHYGLKDWHPGFPAKDATDQSIVYRDSRGWRFCVTSIGMDGAHVRVMMGGPGRGNNHYEAWGRTPEEAARLGLEYGMKDPDLKATYTSSRQEKDFVALTYEYRRGSLD